MKILTIIKQNKVYLYICAIFLAYTMGSFSVYYERILQGNLDNHILSSAFFGVPDELAKHGIKTFYNAQGAYGWDGQFYYYMSNDLLATKDTAEHIDSPSYRYQRVGLSLYTAIVAKVFGQDWVSPTLFFFSYLFLLFLATWYGAKLFSKLGIPPGLILLWAFNVGVQLTLFNALPDAAADAFLILAIAAWYQKRYFLAILPFVFSTLSREAYVLFPSILYALYFLESVVQDNKNGLSYGQMLKNQFNWKFEQLLLIPGLIAVAWQIYINVHFGVSPGSQAHGILGLPFVAWTSYFLTEFLKDNTLGYIKSSMLLLFMGTLIIAFWSSLNIFKKFSSAPILIRSLSITTVFFAMIYVSFGHTVIKDYTGYFKALGLFFFIIPILAAYQELTIKKIKWALALLVIAVLGSNLMNYKFRLGIYSPLGSDQYTNMSKVKLSEKLECLQQYNTEIDVKSVVLKYDYSIVSRILGQINKILITVNLTNKSNTILVSTGNFGGFHMSYQWLNENGKVIQDGIRSAIPDPLSYGESTLIQMETPVPKKEGSYFLKISPIQEGCAWFYNRNKNIGSKTIFAIENTK